MLQHHKVIFIDGHLPSECPKQFATENTLVRLFGDKLIDTPSCERCLAGVQKESSSRLLPANSESRKYPI